jgi:hypothetical protein
VATCQLADRPTGRGRAGERDDLDVRVLDQCGADVRAPPHTAVRGSGLSTTAFPSASAGATDRIASANGPLNGAMTPTTPAGTRRTMLSRGTELGNSSPFDRDGSAAAS